VNAHPVIGVWEGSPVTRQVLPLGLRVDPIHIGVLAKLRILESCDFSRITDDAEKRLDWTKQRASEMETQAKQFLSLVYLDPGYSHTPEIDVDAYWHRMILNTEWYIKFCDDVFGLYCHHILIDPTEETLKDRERSAKLVHYWFGITWVNFLPRCSNQGRAVYLGIAPEPQTMPTF
jgi:hypothetical protein